MGSKMMQLYIRKLNKGLDTKLVDELLLRPYHVKTQVLVRPVESKNVEPGQVAT